MYCTNTWDPSVLENFQEGRQIFAVCRMKFSATFVNGDCFITENCCLVLIPERGRSLTVEDLFQGGVDLFDIFDSYAGGFSVLFPAFFEMVIVMWVYGTSRFMNNVKEMLGKAGDLGIYWRYVVPDVLLVHACANRQQK